MSTKFKIIIPTYNTEDYIQKAIDSVKNQTYDNYECIIIDDDSKDKTLEVIMKNILHDSKFKMIHNMNNVGALANIVKGINSICNDKEDVVVILDGDDQLYDEYVLSTLNEIYENEDVWMTYGSFLQESCNAIRCNVPIENFDRKLRIHSPSHLRTYKYGLFKLINDDDLRDENGEYYRMTGDFAVTFPLMEMAGERSRHVNRIMYLYNDYNPLNDFKKDLTNQERIEMRLRNGTKYELVENF